MCTDFISVAEARKIVEKYTTVLQPVSLPLELAANLILAEDIYATCDIPAFEQSSMDGYAFRWEDQSMLLKVSGEMAAGETDQKSISAGQAMRIFTGAPLPAGADTVAMQEKVSRQGDQLRLLEPYVDKGMFVRHKAAEIATGEKAISTGSLLSPVCLAFLASIGIRNVHAFPMPSVSLIITGKELQNPGKDLLFGQVYESNSCGVTALLKNHFVSIIYIEKTDDELSALSQALQRALIESDLVLMTGGISVGDYDFVLQATLDNGVQKHFHKVRQKPGKPLYFGTKANKTVFGLPGNPASVFTCCYQYVLPAIARMSSRKVFNIRTDAVLATDLTKPEGLTHFLKAVYEDGKVRVLDGQESYRLSSFARANALVELDAERTEFKKGEKVSVLIIDT